MKRICLIILLAVHGVITGVSSFREGWLAPFPPFKEFVSYQIFSDLVVSLIILHLFLFQEVRRKRKPLKPYLTSFVGTAIFGSFAPMVYLLFNDDLF